MIKISKGDRYSRLVIISESERKTNKRRFLCLCDCGKETTVYLNDIRNGNTKSCGCFNSESVSKNSITHGQTKSPEYRSWSAMKTRCTNPNYQDWSSYGGRGISIDPRWIKFENFLTDMGKRPYSNYSLDRIDVNGNYTKENCRWASYSVQNKNKRCTCGCSHCCKK